MGAAIYANIALWISGLSHQGPRFAESERFIRLQNT